MTSREETETLLEKAIDLRILERKFSPEDNRYLTGFAPRFLELMTNRIDRMEAKADKQLEMYEAIAEYWTDISGEDGMIRLNEKAQTETPEFRQMCTLLNDIIDRVYAGSKK